MCIHIITVQQLISVKISEREREREGSVSSLTNDAASISGQTPSVAPSVSESTHAQQSIDVLFDKTMDISLWEPVRPSQALGELLDSRHMLPLLFPTDPKLLAALPAKKIVFEENKRTSRQSFSSNSDKSLASSNAVNSFSWVSRNRRVREVGAHVLQWVDGIRSASRWGRPVAPDYEEDSDGSALSYAQDDVEGFEPTIKINTHTTPLTRKPSGRAKGRPSMGETTPIDTSFGIS